MLNFIKDFKELVNTIKKLNQHGVSIPTGLPKHLFQPNGTEGIDQAEICELDKSTGIEADDLTRIMTLKPQQGEEHYLLSYALYTDLEDGSEIEFFFKVNGKRVLRLHGRPDDPYKPTKYQMNFGLSPDLSNSGLKNCQILLTPNDELTIDCINRNTEVTAPVGVRIVGYVLNANDQSAKLIR